MVPYLTIQCRSLHLLRTFKLQGLLRNYAIQTPASPFSLHSRAAETDNQIGCLIPKASDIVDLHDERIKHEPVRRRPEQLTYIWSL
jgi:hypothetical protein